VNSTDVENYRSIFGLPFLGYIGEFNIPLVHIKNIWTSIGFSLITQRLQLVLLILYIIHEAFKIRNYLDAIYIYIDFSKAFYLVAYVSVFE